MYLLLLLSVSALLHSTSGQPCPANQYETFGNPPCAYCPAGQFVTKRYPPCSPCPTGQYETGGNPPCALCNTACVECAGPLANQCLACAIHQYKPGAGSTPDYCHLCDPSCAICNADGPSGCLACNAGSVLSNFRCLSIIVPCPSSCLKCVSGTSKCTAGQCVAGYWYDPTTQTCQNCDSTCATCSGSGSKACTTCPPSSTKQADNSCKSNCPFWTAAGNGMTANAQNIARTVYIPPPVTVQKCEDLCFQNPSCPAIVFLPSRNPPGCMLHSVLSWPGSKVPTSELVVEYKVTRC